MPPDPLNLLLFFNHLQLCSVEKKYAWKKCGNYGPPLLKFLATPLLIIPALLQRHLNIFLHYTWFCVKNRTSADLFFWSSLDFAGKTGHLRTCWPFFLSFIDISNSKWGCENWLVIQKGCQQVKRLRTTVLDFLRKENSSWTLPRQ